ncbi:MAG: snapalysin, partial [Kribbellaceae bacterium]|nr:snapalysin [Kribbellaceae bacterium]
MSHRRILTSLAGLAAAALAVPAFAAAAPAPEPAQASHVSTYTGSPQDQ